MQLMRKPAAFLMACCFASSAYASGVPKFDFANFVLETALHDFAEEVQGQLEQLVSVEMQFVADLAGLEIDNRLDLKSLATAVQTSVDAEISRVNAVAANMVPRNACQMYSTTKAIGTTLTSSTWEEVSAYKKFGPRVMSSLLDLEDQRVEAEKHLSSVKTELFEELVATFEGQAGRNAKANESPVGFNVPILKEMMNRSHTKKGESQLPWAVSLIAGDSQITGVNLKPGNQSVSAEIRAKEFMVRMGKSSLAEWALSEVLRNKRSAGHRLSQHDLAKVIDVDPENPIVQEVMSREADDEGKVGISTELLLSLALKSGYLTEKKDLNGEIREDYTTEIRKMAYQTAARAYAEELALYNDISALSTEALALGSVIEDLTQ